MADNIKVRYIPDGAYPVLDGDTEVWAPTGWQRCQPHQEMNREWQAIDRACEWFIRRMNLDHETDAVKWTEESAWQAVLDRARELGADTVYVRQTANPTAINCLPSHLRLPMDDAHGFVTGILFQSIVVFARSSHTVTGIALCS